MTVINLSRFMRPTVKGWSQDELASLYRAHNFLQQSGMPVGFEQGSSDIGEPWCVFYDLRSEDVVAHFARLSGRYVIAGGVLECAVWGNTLREATEVFYKAVDSHVELSKVRGRSNVVLHPAAKLIFSLSSLFFLLQLDTKDAFAATTEERGDGIGTENALGHSGVDQKTTFWVPRSFVNTEFTGHGINAALMGLFLAQAAAADLSANDAEHTLSNAGLSKAEGLGAGSISTADVAPLANNGLNLRDFANSSVVIGQPDGSEKSGYDTDANPTDADPFIVINLDAPGVVNLISATDDQTVLPSADGLGDEFRFLEKLDAVADGKNDLVVANDAPEINIVSVNQVYIESKSSATGFLEGRLLSVVNLTDPILIDKAGLTVEFADYFDFGENIDGSGSFSAVVISDTVRLTTSANTAPRQPDNILSADQKEDTIARFVESADDVEVFVYNGNIYIVDAEVKLSGTSDFYIENITFDDDSRISLIGLGSSSGDLALFA